MHSITAEAAEAASFFTASIQPISELPILTSSFANSQSSSRASTIFDVYLNQRLRLSWNLG